MRRPPEELDLWRYKLKKTSAPELFDLRAVIEWSGRGRGQVGRDSAGHFVLYVRVGEQWFLLNDQLQKVYTVTPQQISAL